MRITEKEWGYLELKIKGLDTSTFTLENLRTDTLLIISPYRDGKLKFPRLAENLSKVNKEVSKK